MAAPARRGTSTAKAAIPQLTWDQIRPAPIVLVTGAETVLADRSTRLLRDILKAEDPTLEVSELDAGAYSPGELMTLASPSLFGEPRFIRVEGVEKMTDALSKKAEGRGGGGGGRGRHDPGAQRHVDEDGVDADAVVRPGDFEGGIEQPCRRPERLKTLLLRGGERPQAGDG